MRGFDLGVPASLAWLDAYSASPPVEAQFKVNGSTPLRRAEKLRERRAKAVRDTQIERYDGLRSTTREEVDDADRTVDLLADKIESWLTDMASGVLEPEEVLKRIAECPRVLTAVQESYDSAERSAEAASAMIDLSPADYEQSLIERFPHLANSLPVVTEGWLKGDLGAPDPLGGE